MKRTFLAAVAVLIFLAGSIGMAVPELTEAEQHAVKEANRYVERANAFVKDNSLKRAVVEYEKALKVFPKHLDALYNLAVVYEKLRQNDASIDCYKRYLAIAPNDADAWNQLGLRYDDAGKTAEAQAAYEKSIAANPKFGLALNNLGVLLKEQGKLKEAEPYFEQFVKVEESEGRRNDAAYYSLGALYLAEGRLKDAKLLLQKALDTDPSIPHYNNAMGDVYLAEKHPDLALEAYRKAVQKDEKYAPAYSGMGDAYKVQGERDKAADAYRKALELRPDYNLVNYKLGLLYESTDPAQAIKYLEKYITSGKNSEFQKQAKEKIEQLKQVKSS
jgi:Tfp pilus assembly protein PilF